jgi:hypothetical protein
MKTKSYGKQYKPQQKLGKARVVKNPKPKNVKNKMADNAPPVADADE